VRATFTIIFSNHGHDVIDVKCHAFPIAAAAVHSEMLFKAPATCSEASKCQGHNWTGVLVSGRQLPQPGMLLLLPTEKHACHCFNSHHCFSHQMEGQSCCDMLYALKGNVCAEYTKNAWQHRLTKPKLTSSSLRCHSEMHRLKH